MNIKCLRTIQSRLESINGDGESQATDGSTDEKPHENVLLNVPADIYDISREAIDEAKISDSMQVKLEEKCPTKLMELQQELVTSQDELLRSLADEEASAMDDARRAKERRQDYSPIIHRWLTMLAEKEGVVKSLLENDF